MKQPLLYFLRYQVCGWICLCAFLAVHGQQSPAIQKDVFSQKQRSLKPLNPNSPAYQYPSVRPQAKSPFHAQSMQQPFLEAKPFTFTRYRLKSSYQNIKTGTHTWMETHPQVFKAERLHSQTQVQRIVYTFLKTHQASMGLENPQEELKITSIEADELGHWHIRLTQYYKGVPVYGKEGGVHLRPDGSIVFMGHLAQTPTLSGIEPHISSATAIANTLASLRQEGIYKELSPKSQEFLSYTGPEATLILFPLAETQTIRLAYQVESRPNFRDHMFSYVDAQTGDILYSINHTCTIGPVVANNQQHLNGSNVSVNTFDLGNNSFLLYDASKSMYQLGQNDNLPSLQGHGGIITLDQRNFTPLDSIQPIFSNNNTWDPTAVAAHTNASISYDYFEQRHSRVAIDGNGGDILSVINVPDDDGSSLGNAFWNGVAMFYGNGDNAFSPLAEALDVAGHELTHGVIQATANLEYANQSGALNESFADVFGVLIENETYALGEDIVNTQFFTSGALRNILEPNQGLSRGQNGWQPQHMDEFVELPNTPQGDNGGVHVNSGIPNRAFGLFEQDDQVSTVQAEQVYYRALTVYLTRSSNFLDCRRAIIQSAEDLFGATVSAAAARAFDAVGIVEPSGGGGPEEPTSGTDAALQDLPANPGDNYIFYSSTDANEQNQQFIFNVQTGTSQPVSTTRTLRPISVTDDGAFGYYVDTENFIRRVNTDPTLGPANEIPVSNTGDWANVAISKDGTRLAAISNQQDTSIYVFDLVNNTGARYILFNPTTGQGVQGAGVIFADAIEWDYTGEFIMYDAFNRLSSIGSDDIEYWDVGFIRVWDNDANTFALESSFITKLFTDLPDGVSVGNARFSKNSPYIIAFDYLETDLDTDETTQALLTNNTETGDIGSVFQNTESLLSFPTYGNLDDRIVFGANSTDEPPIPVVAVVGVAEDKLNPEGNVTIQIQEANRQWPVWYSTGTRSLSVKNSPEIPGAAIQVYPNPFREEIHIDYTLEHSAPVNITLHDLAGRRLSVLHHSVGEAPGQQQHQFEVDGLSSGVYLIRIEIGNQYQMVKMVRQ